MRNQRCCLLVLLLSLSCEVSVAAQLPLVALLTPSNGYTGDYFSQSIAISGSTLAVGAEITVGGNAFQGAVYIFVKPSSGWTNATETAMLTASDGGPNQFLGASVAISADTVVALGKGADGQTAEYVFVKPANGWKDMTESAKLTLPAGEGGPGLSSVAISADTVVAAAPALGNFAGAVYIYQRPSAGWVSTSNYDAKLTTSDGEKNDGFGAAVAIQGQTLVVGASDYVTKPGTGLAHGAAYVFAEPANGWSNMTETARLLASDGRTGDRFGFSVAISGTTIVIGAPFSHTGTGQDEQGEAYIFVRPASGWSNSNETARLRASDGMFADQFGTSAAVVPNETQVVIGALQADGCAGAAYVFVKPPSGWSTTTRFNAKLTASEVQGGLGSTVSTNGQAIFAGAHGTANFDYQFPGTVYVFGH